MIARSSLTSRSQVLIQPASSRLNEMFHLRITYVFREQQVGKVSLNMDGREVRNGFKINLILSTLEILPDAVFVIYYGALQQLHLKLVADNSTPSLVEKSCC